jgi:ABC-2 type transport system permease protein
VRQVLSAEFYRLRCRRFAQVVLILILLVLAGAGIHTAMGASGAPTVPPTGSTVTIGLPTGQGISLPVSPALHARFENDLNLPTCNQVFLSHPGQLFLNQATGQFSVGTIACDPLMDNRWRLASSLGTWLSGFGGAVAIASLLLAITFFGLEWSYGGVAGELMIEPRRGRVLAAKTVVLTITTVVTALVVMMLTAGVCLLLGFFAGTVQGAGSTVALTALYSVLRLLLLTALLTLAGASLANLTRSSGISLGILLIVLLLSGPLLFVLQHGVPTVLEALLPLPNIAALVSGQGQQLVSLGATPLTVEPLAAGLVLGAETALLLVASAWSFTARELS